MRKLNLATLSLAAAFLASSAFAQPGHGPISGGGGGGGGVTGLTSCADGTALADNSIMRADGTTKCQGSAVTVGDVGSNLIPFTASTGNRFSFTGSTHYPFQVVGSSGAVAILGELDASNSGLWLGETSPGDTNYALLADGTNLTLNIPSAGGSFYIRRNDSSLIATLSPNSIFSSVPILGFRKVVASTEGVGAPYVIPQTTTWALNTNEGSTAKNYQELGTAVAGEQHDFCVQDSDGLRVTAFTGDTIRQGASVTTTGGYIESTTIGSCVTLTAINATEWFVTSTNDLSTNSWSFN